MAWQKFNRRSASRTTEPTITVQRRGTLSLSGPSVRLLMGSSDYADKIKVDLLYDSTRQLIGICKADSDTHNPHILRRQGKSDVYLASGTLFCAHYGIDTSVARRYRAKVHDGVLGIRLTDDHAIVGRRVKDRDKQETKKDDVQTDQEILPGLPDSSGPPEDSEEPDPWSR